jgi:hypothetical protein
VHFPGLIQPIQIALGWKRIEFSKVEKCYEQAAYLVLLILNECKRQLYNAYLFQMEPQERATILLLVENEENMAEYIAQAFPQWMERQLLESTDEDFKRILNFVKMARKYRFGCASIVLDVNLCKTGAQLPPNGATLILRERGWFWGKISALRLLYDKLRSYT